MKLILLILSLTLGVCADGGMVRVVSVDGARTLTVEREGRRERIQLAGVEVLDEARAAELLRWTVGTSWVLVETHAGGGHLVWRSPDALFVNRELVLRGYARATAFDIAPASNLNVTYLGQFDPPLSAGPQRNGSDSDRRSTAKPSRKTRKNSSRRTPSPRSRRPGS